MAELLADPFVRLSQYRQALIAEIRRVVDVVGHGVCKPDEGYMEVHFPAVFDITERYAIVVRCYVASATSEREFWYQGATLGECVDLATADLAVWVVDNNEYLASEKEQKRICS